MSRTRSGAVLDAPRLNRGAGSAEHNDDAQAEDTGRRLRRRARRRQRRWLFVSAVLVASVSIAGPALRRHFSAKSTTSAKTQHAVTASPKPTAPVPKTVLVLHMGPDGRADLALLAGLDNHATHPALLLMPTGSQIQTPSLGLQTIADLPRLGDATLATTTIENLLDVRISKTIVLTDLELLAAVTPSGSLHVDFDNAVHVQDGAQVFAYPAGPQQLSPGDVARIVGRLETGDELAHLKTLQTVFAPWFASLHDAAVREKTATSTPDFDRFVAVVGANPKILTLPVQAAATGGGSEIYRVDRGELADIMSANFDDVIMAHGQRPRLQLLNGTGAVGVAQKVAACVVPSGYEVALTDNVQGFGVKATTIVAQHSKDLPAARSLAKLLGVGAPRRATKANDLVDVSVVIGADFQNCVPASGG